MKTQTEKFLPDLARALPCGILTFVGTLAIISGSVFLINGAIHGAERPDMIFFGAVTCAGLVSCAGAIFLSGRPGSLVQGVHGGGLS